MNDFLLKEDGFYLLLETGDKIILDGGATPPAPTPGNSTQFLMLMGLGT